MSSERKMGQRESASTAVDDYVQILKSFFDPNQNPAKKIDEAVTSLNVLEEVIDGRKKTKSLTEANAERAFDSTGNLKDTSLIKINQNARMQSVLERVFHPEDLKKENDWTKCIVQSMYFDVGVQTYKKEPLIRDATLINQITELVGRELSTKIHYTQGNYLPFNVQDIRDALDKMPAQINDVITQMTMLKELQAKTQDFFATLEKNYAKDPTKLERIENFLKELNTIANVDPKTFDNLNLSEKSKFLGEKISAFSDKIDLDPMKIKALTESSQKSSGFTLFKSVDPFIGFVQNMQKTSDHMLGIKAEIDMQRSIRSHH